MPARRSGIALALAAACFLGCAKKGPPSGGPADIEPPVLVSSDPDSGAAGVHRDAVLSLTFSEGMEPRSTGEAIAISPPIAFRRLQWSRRTVSITLADSLRPRQAYTLFVGRGARDLHGNTMDAGGTVVFTTADSFPPGSIEGRLEALGFSAGGTYLWCYDEGQGHKPDSTGRDFDAVGLVDVEGRFRIPGLPVPGRYRLWAFGDLDGNRSFEPERDILARIDTLISLTAAVPRAKDLAFKVVNPRAPAVVKGTVLDSLSEREGELYVVAVADTDTTRRVLTATAGQQPWEIQLDPGAWTIRAFRDLDHNRVWDPAREPSSQRRSVRLAPAEAVEGVLLVLEPAARAP